MTAHTTLELIRVLVTLAVLHQALESLALRALPRWDWSIVRDDYRHWPRVARILLDSVAARPRILDGAVAVTAALSLAIPPLAQAFLPVMVVGVVVASLRVRGSIGGASDSMTLHVLGAVWLGETASGELIPTACVYFVAVQSILSYFLAGLSKIQHPDWRSGVALTRYARQLSLPGYGRWVANPAVAAVAAWTVVGFECAFPLALLSSTAATALIAVAAAFHVANALVFGLHRFLLPWLATYPAILYIAST